MRKHYIALFTLLTPILANGQTIYFDDFEQTSSIGSFSGGFEWSGNISEKIVPDPTTSESNSVLSFFFKGNPDLSKDAASEQRFSLGGLYKELWLSYRIYVPSNYYHRDAEGSDNAKGYIMLWSGEYQSQNNQAATSWWPTEDGSTVLNTKWRDNGKPYSQHFSTDTRGVSSPKAIDLSTDLGKWHDFTIYVKTADQNSSNGTVQVWKDQALVHSHYGIANWGVDSTLNGITRGYILGWANAGFNEDTTFYVDDFIVGTTPESIGMELNAPIFNNPTYTTD